ncbi:hypothetical protein BDZ45DRAFT_772160 [Acephala macrosclerotiorum]|nr:hypothetical protein BDZ45DRAFT_772160 [Acephala macrosclerotiorum]
MTNQKPSSMPGGVGSSSSEAVSSRTNVASQHSNISTDEGYGKLAKFIAKSPDIAIFRKFGVLNMMNLLRLQAELHGMEQQLEEARVEDKDSGDRIRSQYGVNFRLMRQNAVEGESTQYDLPVDIGQKLDNTALDQTRSLDKAAQPRESDLEFLRIWLDRGTMGDGFLVGVEATVWSKINFDDLITIRSPPEESDKFTKLLNGTLLDMYNYMIGRFSKSEKKVIDGKIRVYKKKNISRISNGIVAALSAIIPTVVILTLHFVHRMIYRIGLVIVFTAVFAITLALFTEAKKIEIFSASAAFAAVEVVYIGSTS